METVGTVDTFVREIPATPSFKLTGMFSHRLINDLIKKSAERIETVKDAADERYTLADDVVMLNNAFGQTIPCSSAMYEFAMQVKKALPKVEFLADPVWYVSNMRITGFQSLRMVYPDEAYELGAIMFTDPKILTDGLRYAPNRWRTLDESKFKYVVMTPHIENFQYSDTSVGFHSKVTSKLETAIKLAKKFVRPHTPTDMFRIQSLKYPSHSAKSMDAASRAFTDARAAVCDAGVLSALVDTVMSVLKGTEVSLPNMRITELVNDFATKRDEWRQVRDTPLNVDFLVLRADNSVAVISGSATNRQDTPRSSGTMRVYPNAESLPDEVKYKLAVLSMDGDGSYVEEVGIKTSDRTFWVEQ